MKNIFLKLILPLMLAACCVLTACSESEDSSSEANTAFLAGGIWETVVKSADDEDDSYLIAYQFDEDGKYYLYNNLVVISQGTYNVDEDGMRVYFYSSDGSQEWSAAYEYDEENEAIRLEAETAVEVTEAEDSTSDESSETVTEMKTQYLILSKISEEDAEYYDSSNEMKVYYEKATDEDE